MGSAVERVRAVIAPLVDARGLVLYDLEHAGGVLKVSVDQEGGSVDIDAIAKLTREISRALDDTDPIDGRYTLEVSSPGLERTLRTPAHFAGAVGLEVRIKLRSRAAADGERRISGVLASAEGERIVVRDESGVEHELGLESIDRARTVFQWGPGPKPKASKKAASDAAGKKPAKKVTAAS